MLHYLQKEDSVLCFYCVTAIQRKLPVTGYCDKTFTETGFNNWQKACSKFSKHEQSVCHRYPVDMIIKSSWMRCLAVLTPKRRPRTEKLCTLFCPLYVFLFSKDYLCEGVLLLMDVVNPTVILCSYYKCARMIFPI